MNNFDFNTAEKQTEMELIPAGEIVPVYMTVKPGGNGEGGWLKKSQSSESLMLDCELTVTEGEYAKRKIWQLLTVDGSEKAVNISRKTLRAMIEASKGIAPEDMSPAALEARKITGWEVFNGLAFIIKVGIQKAQPNSGYSDKNTIKIVITPDMPEYQKISPPETATGGYTPAPKSAPQQPVSMPSSVPAWLKKSAA